MMKKEQENIPARFKSKVEDFIVEELAWEYRCTISKEDIFNKKTDMTELNANEQKEFVICDFEKKDIDSFRAKKEFAMKLHKGVDALGFAGIKDKKAHTVQRVSIWKPNIEHLQNFIHPNIAIKNCRWGKRKIKMGYLEGNKFTVVLRDIDAKNATKVAHQIRKTQQFANYFGKQRFGSVRKNNAKIGYAIIKKRFKEAVQTILCETHANEQEAVTNARLRLKNEQDYKAALEYFPSFLSLENKILQHLATNRDDYYGAIRLGERKSLLLYVHALQSELFNEMLRQGLEAHIDFTKKGQRKLPLVGYKTTVDEGKIGSIERAVLEARNLTPQDFRLPEIPYLSLKGDLRDALITVTDIDITIEDDEMNKGTKKLTLQFALPAGVYATTFLENFFELIEPKSTY